MNAPNSTPRRLEPQPTDGRLRISDLNIAGFLITRGREILAVEGNQGRQILVFDSDAQADVDDFFCNAPIPARTFAANLRDLKGLVKGVRR